MQGFGIVLGVTQEILEYETTLKKLTIIDTSVNLPIQQTLGASILNQVLY